LATVEQGSLNFSGSTTIGTVNIAPYTIVGNGKTTVTTAGTAVQLASSTAIKSVTIRALASNTNKIYVGSSSVSSANGFQLSKQETVSLDVDNLNKVWLDCDTNGEGVTFIYLA
jgi:hypothetical protein